MNTKIKQIYLIIGTALLLSACAQDDQPSGGTKIEDRRIIFRTSLPEITSRATEIAKDLPYFHVTAFNPADHDFINEDGAILEYFNNVKIEQEKGTFISDKCIWPLPEKDGDMTFFAYYPSLADGQQLVNKSNVGESGININYRIENYRVASDIAGQVDFVTAKASGSLAENLFSGITLNFIHQLCRIEVKAWGANKSGDIEIAGVRIGGAGVQGKFDFAFGETGAWSDISKDKVEYIYREGDEIVSLSLKNDSHSASSDAISIMGTNIGEEANCAMLIPYGKADGWDYNNDRNNENGNMYLSVLLRVTDHEANQQYPFTTADHGANALNLPKVYLAIDDNDRVTDNPGQLYKGEDGKYYTDANKTIEYILQQGSKIKEFGWAALPITGNWQAGNIYTYTLDYSYGIGLHDPDVEIAGDPIISDKVGVAVSVKKWQSNPETGVEVPES